MFQLYVKDLFRAPLSAGHSHPAGILPLPSKTDAFPRKRDRRPFPYRTRKGRTLRKIQEETGGTMRRTRNEAGYRLRETIYSDRAERADRAVESGSADNSVFPRPTKDFARRAV